MCKRKIIREWSITVLLSCIILLLTVPLLLGAAYTYPAADDFIVESGSRYMSEIVGSVRGPICAAWNYFMDWQGAYTSNLFLFVVMPFSRFGLNGFRVVMVILSLSFLVSLYFMLNAIINFSHSREFVSDRQRQQNKKLFLYAVLLLAALGMPGTWMGKEVFFWYTGAMGYLIGIICLFLSLGCFLLANCCEKNRRYYVCSTLFGFAASGTSPQVASFVCSWLLIALLMVAISLQESGGKRHVLWNACPFFVSLCGAVINVAAPGSLRRSRATMGEIDYSVANAIKDSFRVWKEELDQIWHDPFFITLAVILFVVCICFGDWVTKKERPANWFGAFRVVCGAVVSQYLCIFPVVLGYHGSGLSNDRTKYIADFEIRFSLILVIIYAALCTSQMLPDKRKRNRIFYLGCILCGVFMCTAGFLFLNNSTQATGYGYSFELIREFANGTVHDVFSLRKEVLEALEAAEDGTDIYLQMPPLPTTRVTYSQGIADVPEGQTNQAVASIFHLNSVAVEYGNQ